MSGAKREDTPCQVYRVDAVTAITYGLANTTNLTFLTMSYSRLSHLLLTARCVALACSHESEYGIKQAQQRIELRGKWSF